MSLAAALSTEDTKTAAEKSMLTHLLWFEELLATGVLSDFRRCDTRDMSSDGRTKGCVHRGALRSLAEGQLAVRHETRPVQFAAIRQPTAGERATSGRGAASKADIAGDGPATRTGRAANNPFEALQHGAITQKEAMNLLDDEVRKACRQLALASRPDKGHKQPVAYMILSSHQPHHERQRRPHRGQGEPRAVCLGSQANLARIFHCEARSSQRQ